MVHHLSPVGVHNGWEGDLLYMSYPSCRWCGHITPLTVMERTDDMLRPMVPPSSYVSIEVFMTDTHNIV